MTLICSYRLFMDSNERCNTFDAPWHRLMRYSIFEYT